MKATELKKIRIWVNLISIAAFMASTLVTPAGFAAVGTTSKGNSIMPAGSDQSLKPISSDDILDKITEKREVTAEEKAKIKEIFGEAAATVKIVSLAGGNHCYFYDADGNLIGKSSQVTGTQSPQPVKWYNAEGKLVSEESLQESHTTWAPATAEQKAKIQEIFGKEVVTVKTVSLAGGNHCSFYDADGNLIGKSSQVTGTQQTQPVRWYNAEGKLVQTESGLQPPERPGDDVTDPAVWQKYYKEYINYINQLTDPDEKAQAWENLTADFLKLAETNPEAINIHTFWKVSVEFAAYLKELYRNDPENTGSSMIQARLNYLKAAVNFVESEAFDAMTAAEKKSIISSFLHGSIEACWRVDSASNPEIFNQVAKVYNKIFSSQDVEVKAHAFNGLMHYYRVFAWQGCDPDGANSVLKGALDFEGGLESLIEDFEENLNNTDLDDDVRGTIAVAIANVVYHQGHLNGNSEYQIDSTMRDTLIKKISGFLNDVNEGNITINASNRNGLLHMVGGVANQIVNRSEQETEAGKSLVDSFIEFGVQTLEMSEEDGISLGVRTTAINKLIQLHDAAANKKDDALALKAALAVLANVDMDEYNEQVQEALKTNKNADFGAWMAQTMTNITRLTMELEKADISAETLCQILESILNWLDPEETTNLLDMRHMGWQANLFIALCKLGEQIYTSGSELAESAEIAEYFEKIFSVVQGLQDEKVKEVVFERMEKLIAHMRENGFNEVADKLEFLTCPDSASLIAKAWDYYNAGDYTLAAKFANALISNYSDKAAEQQESLSDFAPEGEEADYWALNDVATAHFILGKIAVEDGDTDTAKEHFQKIIDDLGFAQCYDPDQDLWWKVAEGAADELEDL